MKKTLITIAAIFCAMVISSKAFAYQITADAKTKRIPMGTKLEVEMASDVTTNSVNQGDMFTAYLTRDVRTTTTMILPRGTIVRGNIANVKAKRMLSRAAVLYLSFDHVVAPNGSQLPIKAGIADNFNLDINGGIKGGEGYGEAIKEDLSEAGNIIKKSTKWGITSGENWFKGGKFLVTPFSAIGGTVAGTGYFIGTSIADLFQKGNDVVVKKGTIYNILLLEPLDVPVSE